MLCSIMEEVIEGEVAAVVIVVVYDDDHHHLKRIPKF